MAIHRGPSPSPFPQPDRPLTRLLAVTYKSVFILILVCKYVEVTTPVHRAAAFVASIMFAVIETLWTTVSLEDPVSGRVTLCGWRGSLGHSSFAQFWVNMIFTPALLFGYRSLVSAPSARILLFPLNVWVLEVVEGYLLMFLFGRNVAWEYRGNDTYFHGNIKLQYVLPWVGLGSLVELLWAPVLMPLSAYLTDEGSDVLLLATTAIVAATLAFAPRMSICAILSSFLGE